MTSPLRDLAAHGAPWCVRKYWRMVNGYCLPTDNKSMGRLAQRLKEEPNWQRSGVASNMVIARKSPIEFGNHTRIYIYRDMYII